MKKLKPHQRLTLTVSGGVGYLVVAFEWLGLLVLYLPSFFDSLIGQTIFPEQKTPTPQPVEPGSTQMPSELTVLLTVLAGVVLLGLIVYVIFMRYVPTITKSASKAVHVTAQKAVPVVARKPVETIPARRRKLLTARLVLWLKVLAVVIPVAVFGIVHVQRRTINTQLALLALSALALIAIGAFLCQLLLARRWRANEADIS